MRPFVLVMFAALGVLTLKMASLFVDQQTTLQQAGLDPIVTGSANRIIREKKIEQLPLKPVFTSDNAEVLSKAIATMQPKEAARFFSTLDIETQSEIAPKLSASLLGDILTQMPTDKAEGLTKSLMKRGN
jgi:Mg/Co/Ni transporter MgtE